MLHMPVKDTLRAHLTRCCAEEELSRWYDPLHIAMDPEESCLTVTFPHHLFGPWFARTGQAPLEACLADCLGKDMPVRYLAGQHLVQSAHITRDASKDARREKPFGDAFTLESFIVNQKNAFPLAVAREVAQSPKEPPYNPLVYYGKHGSGKTHLLRAIANSLSETGNAQAIFYGSAVECLKECAQQGSSAGLLKYNAYCVDDIHLFTNDVSLQEKLLLFLEACLFEKKQFVCTNAGPLVSHRGLAESLRSRLARGLVVALKNPDLDVRMRFAQAQCLHHGVDMAQEHVLLLAQRCARLCHLSGVLLKIAAYTKLTQRTIEKQDIEKILKHSGGHSPVTPQDIIRQVAAYFTLSPEELTSKKRNPAFVFARQTAMYLCRDILGTSYPQLGQLFGGKDHSTVIYSIKKIEKYFLMHNHVHKEITEIKNMCLQKGN